MPNYKFVGLANYKAVLSDPNFFNAFFNSIKWTIFSLVGQVLVGFVLALALHRVRHFKKLYRTLLIVPWAFPTIVIAFSWQWILNGVYGYLPNLIVKLGLMEHTPAFLTDSTWAFLCLVFINIWFGAPMIMVNVLSALQTVPEEQFEAAKIDGASSWQVFKFIVFPHIKVVVGLLVVLRTVWIFNNFDIIYLITGGGPANATTTLPILLTTWVGELNCWVVLQQLQYCSLSSWWRFALSTLLSSVSGKRRVENNEEEIQYLFRYSLTCTFSWCDHRCNFPIGMDYHIFCQRERELTQYPTRFWPEQFTLDYFTHVINDLHFIDNIRNSLIIALATTLIAIIISAMAAYGIVRFFPKLGAIMSRLLVITYIFPPILLAIPYSIAIAKVGLTNSLFGLMMVYLSFSVPYAVWLLVGFFQTVPIGIEEAARIDGANKFVTFYKVVLPIVAPGIVATAIYTFINAWNEFLYALILINNTGKMTVAVALRSLNGSEILDWGDMMAASVIVVLPSIIFFSIIQNKIASGLSEGSVK